MNSGFNLDERARAGTVLVECLLTQGINTVFGVPGESFLAVIDGLYEYRRSVTTIMARCEGGASFMAAAYAKLTGHPGICFVTRGPGATNASIGVHSAMQDSVPMILFIGQVAAGARGREAFQEVDYANYMGEIAKASFEIREAERLPEILARGLSACRSGRPGPVAISLPEDMLQQPLHRFALPEIAPAEPACSNDTGGKICDILQEAEKPVVLMGSCGWRQAGKEALKRFVTRNELPVVVTFRCQDQFDNHSRFYVGDAGVGMEDHIRTMLAEADVILALGTRFSEITTDGYRLFRVPCPKQRIIHVHPGEMEIGKIYVPELGVQAGVNATLAALERFSLSGVSRRRDWCRELRRRYLRSVSCPSLGGTVDMNAIMRWLRTRLPPDSIVTTGAGNFAIWPGRQILYGERARLLGPQAGAMGYSLPAAIAARLVHPERTVICFTGDGDFQMTCQELGTAVQHGAVPIIILCNNGIYGTIRMHQEREYPARVHGTDITNPDFVALAKSYGLAAEAISRTDEFAPAFERAVQSRSGYLLELQIDQEDVLPRKTLSGIRRAAQDLHAEKWTEVAQRLSQLYQIVDRFEEMFPGRKFSPDGHLLETLGKVIAEYMFDVELVPTGRGNAEFEARAKDGGSVKIILTQGNKVTMKGAYDYLLVLRLKSDKSVEVVFNGPLFKAWPNFESMPKGRSKAFSVTTLRKRQEEKVASFERLPLKRELSLNASTQP